MQQASTTDRTPPPAPSLVTDEPMPAIPWARPDMVVSPSPTTHLFCGHLWKQLAQKQEGAHSTAELLAHRLVAKANEIRLQRTAVHSLGTLIHGRLTKSSGTWKFCEEGLTLKRIVSQPDVGNRKLTLICSNSRQWARTPGMPAKNTYAHRFRTSSNRSQGSVTTKTLLREWF
ncbi:hypothetical protein LIA77_01132 [Sarocladium implicatum]|nr:hypothetical protein LIA77_01132 [Sarocladium implicatum]